MSYAHSGSGIEWDTLNQEVMQQYREGNYSKAALIAEQALRVAEENVGPDHPDVATSLNNLAGLYRTMRLYKEASALKQRAERIMAIKR